MNVIDISIPPWFIDRVNLSPGMTDPHTRHVADGNLPPSVPVDSQESQRITGQDGRLTSWSTGGAVFDTINDLPIHPLVIHAVVVLLPLACVGLIAIAVHPPWRARFGVLVVLVAAAATAAIPVATESGERLAARLGEPADHAALGGRLIWFAAPLLLVAIVLVGVHWRAARSGVAVAKGLAVVLSVLAIVAAGANLYQVYRVGDSG